jgi:ribonuclease HII
MAARTGSTKPSLRVERALQRQGHRLLAGMDEVGRGALAGPVSVGVVVIDETCRSAPAGVKDSKLLTSLARERMVTPIRRWALAHAVGHASPAEIDAVGIMAALRLAGTRALARLDVVPDLVILDGNHDWLTDPGRVGLLAFAGGDPSPGSAAEVVVPPVTTMIKADLKCSSVAAASVLAKVERDAMMVRLAAEVGRYAWELNKGYSAPEHLAALSLHGPCEHHRRSWRLPGVASDPSVPADQEDADWAAEDAGWAEEGPGWVEDPVEGTGDVERTGEGAVAAVSAESVMGDDGRVPEVSVR